METKLILEEIRKVGVGVEENTDAIRAVAEQCENMQRTLDNHTQLHEQHRLSFDKVDVRLIMIEEDVRELKDDVKILKTDVRDLKVDIRYLKEDMHEVRDVLQLVPNRLAQ